MTNCADEPPILLLNSYIHHLRFRIHKDAPADYMQKWNALKMKCESGDNEAIIEQMKTHCQLETTKSMPYLRRFEGGMGGNDNSTHKQIRFRKKSKLPRCDDDIVFDRIEGTITEQWTYAELDDLIHAFTQTANQYVEANDCVHGCIEMAHEYSSFC